MKYFIPIIALTLFVSNVDANHHFQSKSIETFSINKEGVITFHTKNSTYTANLDNCSYQELSMLDNLGIYANSSLSSSLNSTGTPSPKILLVVGS